MNYGLHNVIAESLAPKGREVIYKQRLLIVLFTRAMFTSTVKYCFQFNTFVLEGSSFTLSLSTVTDAGPITAVLQCCQLVHCCQTLPAKWTMLDIDPSTTSTSSIRIRSKFVLSHFIMNVVKAHEFFFCLFHWYYFSFAYFSEIDFRWLAKVALHGLFPSLFPHTDDRSVQFSHQGFWLTPQRWTLQHILTWEGEL